MVKKAPKTKIATRPTGLGTNPKQPTVPAVPDLSIVFAGMVMSQNIAEQKRALKDSEERYRQLFENANDIIYVLDLKGNYISINHAAERKFGYTSDEALSMNIGEVVAPEFLEVVKEQLAKKIDGSATQAVYEIECVAKDGKRISLEVNTSVVTKDGVPIAVQGIARDISDRKLVEEQIRKNEEHHRSLFENASDLIYTHDMDGNFTSLNRAGELITGYSLEEALRMNVEDVVAPEFLDPTRTITERLQANPRETMEEFEIIAKDGHRVTLELSTRVIIQDGVPVGPGTSAPRPHRLRRRLDE